MARDFHNVVGIRVLVDASSAPGITFMRKIGKVRYFDASHLWTQEVAAQTHVAFDNVMGTSNPADMMPREVSRADVDKHIGFLDACYPEGRVECAVGVATDEGQDVDVDIVSEPRLPMFNQVADRPGELIAASIRPAIGLDIGEFEGRRHQKNIDIEHFKPKKTNKGLAMLVNGGKFVLGKLHVSTATYDDLVEVRGGLEQASIHTL